MAQGNPNKVNAIVDEIVENNNVFKLKSLIEQDKEKDSIAQSINSAISVLNEVGKELVLQELSIDPDEKFKGFIDSVGNIDISGLTQMTATIVKEKIIEAEKEGIDLRQEQPVFKDSTKALLVGGILTVAVINEMVNNFDNLTTEQRGLLRENYEHLTAEQRSKYDKGMLDKIKNSDLDDKTKEKLTDFFEGDFHSAINNILNILQKNHSSDNFDLSKISPSEILKIIENLDIPKELKDKLKEYNFEKLLAIDKNEQGLADLYLQREEAIKSGNQDKVKILDKLIKQQENSPEHQKYLEMQKRKMKDEREEAKNQNTSQRKAFEKKEAQKYSQEAFSGQSREKLEYIDVQQIISQGIEQLPNKLIKEGFSQEEIKEALKNYTNLIKEFDEEIIDSIKDKDNNELKEWLKELFDDEEEFPVSENVKKILQQLAQNDFEGHLQQILTSPELIQEKFLPALETEIQKLDEKQITDTELEQAKNTEKIKEEFLDASGAIESQKQQESTKLDSPNIPTTPEEHIQESVTSYEQEALEEASQNMAIVEQDNSFIGKIKRVFANMKDMKNKDTSKGFFARLGDSIKNVFGKKNEYFESQDNSKEQANESSASKIEQPLSFDQQLQQGVTQPIINQPSKNSPSKVTHNPEKNDDEIEFE